jgi:hypothetical protein
MKTKEVYRIFLLGILLTCMINCKKSKTVNNPTPATEITYEASNAIFPNPERGFIKTYPVYSEGESLNLPQLKLLRGQNVSLILRVFYFDKFKNQALSPAELLLIQTDIDKIGEAGLKVILRFAYTDDIAGTDAPLSVIEQHLDQLKPLFESNKDIIAFVQAGFIGAWGEWHSSSNGLATIENQRKILNKLLSVLPVEIMVQVRTPGMKQQIFNTTLPVTKDVAYSSENRSRVGHHNDCFLSGGTDYGTYDNIAVEKQYISMEALYVPTGGETCPPTGGYSPDCPEGQKEMKLLKWTYLNLDWYQPTINAWKASGCFDEFQRNLGYRLALVNGNFPNQVLPETSMKVNFTISNKGYAPFYNKKTASLILKNSTSGQYQQVALAVDLRDCKPNVNLTIDETVNLTNIPEGIYDLYIKISDNAESLKMRSEYSIRLANTDLWTDENGGMNRLKHQLKIANK